MSLIEKAKQYVNGLQILTDWLGTGATPVDPVTAQTRANICLKCPKNVANVALSVKVINAIREHVELKNKLQLRVEGEKSLNTCSVCQCVLRLKVHVPIAVIRGHMRPGEFEELPSHCWQKTEL